jgi:hypothetical protein
MSFAKKLITVELQLASGGGIQTISGLRVSATITRMAGPDQATAEIAIYGLPLSLMNTMSRIGRMFQTSLNKVALYAGEEGGQMSLAFIGQIFWAWVDGAAMPDVAFRISAGTGGGYWAVAPTTPVSKQGSQDAAQMLSGLAQKMGLTFENNGVNTKLMNPYYPGNPWTQAMQIAKHINADLVVDKGIFSITPAGQSRQGSIPLISRDTIEVGYPAFAEGRVVMKCTWSPSIVTNGKVQIQSDITPANGIWNVIKVTDEIATILPHGPWFSFIECGTLSDSPSWPA